MNTTGAMTSTIFTGKPSASGCGLWSNGTYSFCFIVVSSTPAACEAPVSITVNGDGFACAGACSCGTFTCDNLTTSQNLPVEYSELNLKNKGNEVLLNWSTQSEINNDYFEIERSYDATSFEVIGFINGSGNSSELIEYSYVDRSFNKELKHLYYRLKQVDFDGTIEYSDVLYTRTHKTNIQGDIKIHPNPARNQLNIEFDSAHKNKTIIKVFDGAGKVCLEKILDAGIKLNSHQLNISDLTTGTFFILVNNGTELFHSKFVKN